MRNTISALRFDDLKGTRLVHNSWTLPYAFTHFVGKFPAWLWGQK